MCNIYIRNGRIYPISHIYHVYLYLSLYTQCIRINIHAAYILCQIVYCMYCTYDPNGVLYVHHMMKVCVLHAICIILSMIFNSEPIV